jgi:glucose-1-phosphate thymidylyltransferase
MNAQGIILAGGTGSRLFPATGVVSKQLLPVYDKPMIYYPLSTLMEADIRNVLIITQGTNIPLFYGLIGGGEHLGMDIRYAEQNNPRGLPEAITIAKKCGCLSHCNVLILGDNLFAGSELGIQSALAQKEFAGNETGATIYLKEVRDPQRYGVAVFDKVTTRLVSVVEKPKDPLSNWAVTGLYIYDDECAERVETLNPSARGELEITDLNLSYMQDGKLDYWRLSSGSAWLDTGTPEALLQASQYVQTIQERHGVMVGCPEEIAFKKGWISGSELEKLASVYSNEYGDYLRSLPDVAVPQGVPPGVD